MGQIEVKFELVKIVKMGKEYEAVVKIESHARASDGTSLLNLTNDQLRMVTGDTFLVKMPCKTLEFGAEGFTATVEIAQVCPV